MEDLELDSDLRNDSDTGLSSSMKNNLTESFKWMKIVGIISLVIMGIVVLMWVMMYTKMPSFARSQMNGPLVILIAMVGFEIWLISVLISAANAFNTYVTTGSNTYLEQAFSKQKTFWVVAGVLAIVGLVFSLFGFVQWMNEISRF